VDIAAWEAKSRQPFKDRNKKGKAEAHLMLPKENEILCPAMNSYGTVATTGGWERALSVR